VFEIASSRRLKESFIYSIYAGVGGTSVLKKIEGSPAGVMNTLGIDRIRPAGTRISTRKTLSISYPLITGKIYRPRFLIN